MKKAVEKISKKQAGLDKNLDVHYPQWGRG